MAPRMISTIELSTATSIGNEIMKIKLVAGIMGILLWTAFILVIGYNRGVARQTEADQRALSDSMCSGALSRAAILSRILLTARTGDTDMVTKQLERGIDQALFDAFQWWPPDGRVSWPFMSVDWTLVKKDRQLNPRLNSPEEMVEIVDPFLETLISAQRRTPPGSE